jgi:hypothetical protein
MAPAPKIPQNCPRKNQESSQNLSRQFSKIAEKALKKSRKILGKIQLTFEIQLNPENPWQSGIESTKI